MNSFSHHHQPLLDVRTFAQTIQHQHCVTHQPAFQPISPAPVAPKSGGKGRVKNLSEKVRCKRLLDLKNNPYRLSPNTPQPAQVARRNERERNRVKQVNQGFATLRVHVMGEGVKNKKMSKVETLKNAIDYIRKMQDLLGEHGNEFDDCFKQSTSSRPSQVKDERSECRHNNGPIQSSPYSNNNAEHYRLSTSGSSSENESDFLKIEDDLWYDSIFVSGRI